MSLDQKMILEENAEEQVRHQVGVITRQTAHHKRIDRAKEERMSGKDKNGINGMQGMQSKERTRFQRRTMEKTSD